MSRSKELEAIWTQVPADYYEKGTKKIIDYNKKGRFL